MLLSMIMNKEPEVWRIIVLALGSIGIVWAIYIIVSLVVDYNADKKKVNEAIKEKQADKGINNVSMQNNTHMNVFPQNNMKAQNNYNMSQQSVGASSQCFLDINNMIDMNHSSNQANEFAVQSMNMQPAFASTYGTIDNMQQYPSNINMPYSQGPYVSASHFTDTGRSGLIGEYSNMEPNCGNFVIIKSVISTETREELELV